MRLRHIAKVATATLAITVLTACGSDRSAETSGGADDSKSASDTFGDMDSPCGKGDASGATDQGVTDDSITIGYGDDRGFVSAPGLSQEVGDAATAMIAWCNEQGGINGRKLVGNQYDAAISNTVQVIKKSCASDFMLVANGFANDFAGDPVRVKCGLPQVPAFTVGPNASMGKLKVEPMPYPVDYYNTAGLKLAIDTVPEIAESFTITGTDAPATLVSNIKVGAAMGVLGHEPKDCGVTIHMAGDASYAPLAKKMKDCGVASYFTAYTPSPQIFGLMQALPQGGNGLPAFAESQWYGQVGAEWNGQTGAAENLVVPLFVQPIENADVNDAVADYKKIVEKSGGKTGMTGEFAASAFLMWAQAAKDCGSELTRDCVMDKLHDVREWTAGGLQAPTDPGRNMPSKCAMLMQLKGDEWSQVNPEKRGEFSCGTSNVIPMSPMLSGIELDDDRLFVKMLG